MTAASRVSAAIALGSCRRTLASSLPYARPQASITAQVAWAPDLTDRVRLTPVSATAYAPVVGLAPNSDQRIAATTVPFELPALARPFIPAERPTWQAHLLGPWAPPNDVRVVGPNLQTLSYDVYLRTAGVAETAGVPLQVPLGTTIEAAVTTDLHQAGDWLGVFRVNALDGNDEVRRVLPNTTTALREGPGAVPVFRVAFPLPTTGQYEVRFFDGATGAFLGQSGTITVVGPATTTQLLTVNGKGDGEDLPVSPGEALVAVLAGSAFGAADVLELVRDDDRQVFPIASALTGNQDIPFVVPQQRGIYQLQWRSVTPAGLVRGPVLHQGKGMRGVDTLTAYYFTDAIGSVRQITDATGAVLSRHDYLPFGTEWPAPGSGTALEHKVQFAGKERDAESGLDYSGARFYASQLGRFMSPDTPGIDQNPSDPQSWLLYSYVRNNPLRYTDPTGEKCENGYNAETGAFCTETMGETPNEDWSQFLLDRLFKYVLTPQVSDFSAGVGDALTGRMIPGMHTSGTEYVRRRMGSDSVVAKSSSSYTSGDLTGGAVGWTIAGSVSATVAAIANGKRGALFGRGGKALFNHGPVRFGWYWKGTGATGRDVIGLRIGPARGTSWWSHIPFWVP